MEPKIVPLNPVPDHPKYLRLPSLSRSLVHSILPKACQAMHTKPIIFSVSLKSSSPEGAPNLSTRVRKPAKALLPPKERPFYIRPNSPSYIYKKMFLSKEQQLPQKPRKYKSNKASKKSFETRTSYYCEIIATDKRSSVTPYPGKLLGKTLGDFKSEYSNTKTTYAKHRLNSEESKRILMKNISEARPSQESSDEELSYYDARQVSL